MDDETQRIKELLDRAIAEEAEIKEKIQRAKSELSEFLDENSRCNTLREEKQLLPNKAHENSLRQIEKESAICAGLSAIVGIRNLAVAAARDGGVQISLMIEGKNAMVHLDQNKAVNSIELSNGEYDKDLKFILSEVEGMPAPQDLRYAFFAVGAIARRAAVLQSHFAELKRTCLVRVTGPLKCTLTMSNGVSLDLILHPCYPEIPAAVHVENVFGIGGWSAEELEMKRRLVNSRCFSSLLDMCRFAAEPAVLGI